MLEKHIQSKIIDYLESKGAYVINVCSPTKAGQPDIVFCYDSAFGAIEVKQPGQKPRPLQIYHIDQINEAGGVAIVATCVEDVARLFDD